MTLIRILIIALLVWLLLRMLKTQLNRYQLRQKDTQEQIDTVVPCQYCGLHIPKHEAIKSDNKYYCSQKHRQLHNNGEP